MALQGGGGGGASAGAIRAGQAFVELMTKDTALERGLRAAEKRIRDWSAVTAKAGVALLSVGGSGLGSIGGAFKEATDRAAEFQHLSERLGLPVDKLSAFTYAAETSGATLEDLKNGWENLAERIDQGIRGSGEAAEAFRRLGVSAADLQVRDAADQFIALSDAMRSLDNDTERRGILSALGGDKLQNLNEFLKLGPNGIRRRMTEAGDVGAVIDPAQAKQAVEAQQAINRAWMAGKSIVFQFGASLLQNVGTLKTLTDQAVAAAATVRTFVVENRAAIATAFAVSAAVAAAGAALIGVGVLGTGVASGIGVVVSVFAAAKAAVLAFLTPVGLVTAAVATIAGAGAYFWLTETDSGRKAAAAVREYWSETGDNLKSAWGGISSALAAGDIGAAFKVAAATVNLEWTRMVVELQKAWNDFKGAFVDGWHDAQLLVAEGMMDFQHGVERGTVDAIGYLKREYTGFFNFLAEKLASLADLLGDSDFAKSLKDLAAYDPGTVAQAVPDAQKRLRDDQQKERNALFDQARRDQEERDKSRMADLTGAQAAVDAAKAEFADTVARANKLTPAKGGGGAGDKAAAAAAQVSGSIGSFRAADVAQRIGGSGASQLDELRKANRLQAEANGILRDVVDKLADLGLGYG